MTRGQIAIIYKEYGAQEISLMTSIEFNGDMYMPTKQWSGYGQQVINALKRVNDVATYQYEVAKFNKEKHHYNDCETLTHHHPNNEALDMLDFTHNYFGKWFSDYVYIKNITDEEVKIKFEIDDEVGNRLDVDTQILKPNAIAVLHFGSLHKLVEPKE